MDDWTVLDRRGDPAPGDPDQIQELATQLLRRAEQSGQQAQRLATIAGNSGELRMEGDYAPRYRGILVRLRDDSTTLGAAHRDCASALSAYADQLRVARSLSMAALTRGGQADGQYRALLRQFCSVVPASSPDAIGRGLNGYVAMRLSQGMEEPVRQWAVDVGRYAELFELDRQQACRMATEAAGMRDEAERRCEQGILAATGSLPTGQTGGGQGSAADGCGAAPDGTPVAPRTVIPDSTMDHVLHGGLNAEGDFVGWHLYPGDDVEKLPRNRFISGTMVTNPDRTVTVHGGVGHADDEWFTTPKDTIKHVFFPESWKEDDIRAAGQYLFDHGTYRHGGTIVSAVYRGVAITGYLDHGVPIAFFPNGG